MADLFDLSSLDESVNIAGKKIPKIALIGIGFVGVVVLVLMSRRGGGGVPSSRSSSVPAPAQLDSLGGGFGYTPGASLLSGEGADVKAEAGQIFAEREGALTAQFESQLSAATAPLQSQIERLTRQNKRQGFKIRKLSQATGVKVRLPARLRNPVPAPVPSGHVRLTGGGILSPAQEAAARVPLSVVTPPALKRRRR